MENLKADICVCASDARHVFLMPYVYCTRCGSIRRAVPGARFTIPLDRSAEMIDYVRRTEEEERKAALPLAELPEEKPTNPSTPSAKKADWDDGED